MNGAHRRSLAGLLLFYFTNLFLASAVTDPGDISALRSLFGALGAPPQLTGWRIDGTGDTCGLESRRGVSCFGPSVISAYLADNHFRGSVTTLAVVPLSILYIENSFSGSVPKQFESIPHLRIYGNFFQSGEASPLPSASPKAPPPYEKGVTQSPQSFSPLSFTDPNISPSHSHKWLGKGAIAGIVIGASSFVVLVAVAVIFHFHRSSDCLPISIPSVLIVTAIGGFVAQASGQSDKCAHPLLDIDVCTENLDLGHSRPNRTCCRVLTHLWTHADIRSHTPCICASTISRRLLNTLYELCSVPIDPFDIMCRPAHHSHWYDGFLKYYKAIITCIATTAAVIVLGRRASIWWRNRRRTRENGEEESSHLISVGEIGREMDSDEEENLQ